MPSKHGKPSSSTDLLKKFIQSHNPATKEQRKQKASKPEVKKVRNLKNTVRRVTCTTILELLKNEVLFDDKGNSYIVKSNRLIQYQPDKSSHVVRIDRKGSFINILYDETKDDLEDEKYNITEEDSSSSLLYENVKALLEGDPKLVEAISQKKVLVPVQISEEEQYWKKLSDEEKRNLLSKIKPPI